jgi:uroporphyrinogen decarboxylase
MVSATSIKNDLILRALNCEKTDRTPVWMMRQAGRYLPEYQAIRSQMSFLELCKNPKKAAEVSLQPYEILGVDAIIMFSDILVLLEPMGAGLDFDTGKPRFVNPTRSCEDIDKLIALDKEQLKNQCHYVYETIEEIAAKLNNEIPILGFAGAPWTLASYMIEGGGSKDFAHIKKMMYLQPQAMHLLLEKLTISVSNYLLNKLDTGVHALQLFDTWASVLSQKDYQEFALPYQQKIVSNIREKYPNASITLYVNGVSNVLDYMLQTGANCLSVDWRVNLKDIREYVAGQNIAIQGNFDPCALLASPEQVEKNTRIMLEQAGSAPGYIANLGHGIIPSVPVESAKTFIKTVQNYCFA